MWRCPSHDALHAFPPRFALESTGHNSKDHCNAHGGRSLYRDMRSAARQPVAGPSNPPPASQATAPSGSAAVAQGRLNTPARAARPSGIGAAAVRRPGSMPAARVPGTPVAARTAVAPAVPLRRLSAPEFQGLDTAQDDSDSSGGSADDCDHHYGGYGGYDSDEDGGSDADHDSYLLEYDSEAPCDSEGEIRYVARPVPADVQPAVKVPMQPLAPAMILQDPVQNANLIELGTIHLPIKVSPHLQRKAETLHALVCHPLKCGPVVMFSTLPCAVLPWCCSLTILMLEISLCTGKGALRTGRPAGAVGAHRHRAQAERRTPLRSGPQGPPHYLKHQIL